MRRKVIAGNWKMNKTPDEALTFINEIKDKIKNSESKVIFCVPFVTLQAALEAAKGSDIAIGAQTMHYETSGAFTGEVSAEMLKAIGVEYVIIGHSERRQYYAETDESVNLKTIKALKTDLIPIVCVGESLTQREQGITVEHVRMQTKIAFKDIPAEDAKNVIVAYEPIWAIGTGKTATSEQAQEVCAAIRQVLSEIYGQQTAEKIVIQYGGSVNGKNAAELFAMPDIDGGLVGGASLKMEFENIVNYNK